MARVEVRADGVDLQDPWLVEGLPGVGLVGKIATDYLVDRLEMNHYADVYCEGLPRIGVYGGGDHAVRGPVRLYADESRNLLALASDVPVSPSSAADFANCVTGWFRDHGVTPLFLSGLAAEKDGDPPSLFGVATGDADELLSGADVATPPESGVVSGPTGALLSRAHERGLDAVALVVEATPKFPDPEAARVLLRHGVEPIAGLDVDLGGLVDSAEEIRRQREALARRMEEAGDETSKAQPLRMYQ